MTGKSKYDRILSIYAKLMQGEIVRKAEMAAEFHVNGRTVQRDLDDIRAFFSNNTLGICYGKQLVYDHRQRGYRLEMTEDDRFSSGEVLAVSLLLMDSGVLSPEERTVFVQKFLERSIKRGEKAHRFVQEELVRREEKTDE